jgi:hypothetical protein
MVFKKTFLVPACPGWVGDGVAPILNVKSNWYWSSTIDPGSGGGGTMVVHLGYGAATYDNKIGPFYSWCARGGR